MDDSRLPYYKFPGVRLIDSELFEDKRGFLFEAFHAGKHVGLPTFYADLVAWSVKDVFRGLHYQVAPHAQAKMIRCLSGEIEDFFLDIREGSPTYGILGSCVLSHDDPYADHITSNGECTKFYNAALFLPVGFAHGYMAKKESIVMYKCSDVQHLDSERSIKFRHGDQLIMSDRDRKAASFQEYAALPSFRWRDGVTTCL